MNTPALTAEVRLETAVIVRPGDKLVFAVPGTIGPDLARRMKADLAAQLPGVEAVIVGGCGGLAVYRDGDQQE